MSRVIRFILPIALILGIYTEGSSQVAVNTDGSAADTKAMLDVKSTDKGVFLPRMTTAQRTGIAGLTTTQKGLLVYDTETNSVWQFNGTTWAEVGSSSGASVWTVKNDSSIYTTNKQVGINNTDPRAPLHLIGGFIVQGKQKFPFNAAVNTYDLPLSGFSTTGGGGTPTPDSAGIVRSHATASTGDYSINKNVLLIVTPKAFTSPIGVRFTFTHFNTEAVNDTVVIKDFSDDHNKNVVFSGSTMPPVFEYSSQNILNGFRIKFQTNGTVNGTGFILKYEFIYADNNNPVTAKAVGTGLMFDANKNALIMGDLNRKEAQIGSFSTSWGYSIASGSAATALGASTASGTYSTASGVSLASGYTSLASGSSTASGNSATAFGANSTASGAYALASGYNSTASGAYSTALGRSIASVDYSTALGNATASGGNSTAMGGNTTASGTSSTASGYYSTASGNTAIAMGSLSTASGDYSVALGNSSASGFGAVAIGLGSGASNYGASVIGDHSYATGYRATALGYSNTAAGYGSTTMGYKLQANSAYSTSIGNQNNPLVAVPQTSIGDWNLADPLFIIGNGDPNFPAVKTNALVVFKNGNLKYTGTLSSGTCGATAFYTTALGAATTASGFNSTAIGQTVLSKSSYCTSIGTLNIPIVATDQILNTDWNLTDPLFIIGNGNPVTATFSNALTMLKNGNMGMGSIIAPTYRIEIPNNAASDGQGIANAWATYSDNRVKFNQKPLQYGLSQVLQMQVKQYDHHSSEFKNGALVLGKSKPTFGLIAQELYKIIPEMVNKPTDDTKDLWSIDYDKFGPLLVKTIQDQQAQIEALKKENEAVKQQITALNSLKADVEALKAALQNNDVKKRDSSVSSPQKASVAPK
jgi:Chaperone of endosialidase/Head domain of trimeric autotransporter adhesin